jgi:hypothetical protein
MASRISQYAMISEVEIFHSLQGFYKKSLVKSADLRVSAIIDIGRSSMASALL